MVLVGLRWKGPPHSHSFIYLESAKQGLLMKIIVKSTALMKDIPAVITWWIL